MKRPHLAEPRSQNERKNRARQNLRSAVPGFCVQKSGRGVKSGAKRPLPDCWVYVRQYCAKIDEAARNRMELIVRSLAEQNGVTEQLKAENQMEWVRQMNACKAQAEEVVKAELIYN